jgi:formylglycine-generating enzyme required for sulfatase activity
MAMVELDTASFCMDKYEFSNGHFLDVFNSFKDSGIVKTDTVVDSVSDTVTYFHLHSDTLRFKMPYSPFSNALNTPVIEVLYNIADTICRSIGKRLCTMNEWQAALGGYQRLNYPYGNTYDSSKCNTEVNGNVEHLKEPTVVPVDSPSTCVSPYRIYDLSGNVGEWVVNTDIDKYPAFDNLNGYELRYFAGGSWYSKSESGITSLSPSTLAKARTDVGFRCCKSVR